MRTFQTGVCVIGGGPAGSVFAARLAALGHRVTLVERCTFPRPRVGESLTRGVMPLLDTIGARGRVEQAGFLPVPSVQIRWAGTLIERRDSDAYGLVVDRGRFDSLLLDTARAAGVQILQPAAHRESRSCPEGWAVSVNLAGQSVCIHARFLADASGRSFAIRGPRQRTGPPTTAFYTYWRGAELPNRPRIEAGADAWFWGVPLPGGIYNTLAFVDPRTHHPREFDSLLRQSGLLEGCRGLRRSSPVLAADATSYLDSEPVASTRIKVGDAALTIDPLSSSGVQKAIQSALAGAVVVNTLLRKPELSEPAIAFYRSTLDDVSANHCHWAGEYYAQAAAVHTGEFWRRRALTPAPISAPPAFSPGAFADVRLTLSPQLQFFESPCLDGEFVALKTALQHPALNRPVAFIGGCDMPPLLRRLPAAGLKPIEIAGLWSGVVPVPKGLAIAGWLAAHGLLIPAKS